MTEEERIQRFKIAWECSPAAQLLIPNPSKYQLDLGQESGELASIALLASERDELSALDSLVNRWEIPLRGTAEFKGKLEENWLAKDPKRQRNVCNDTLAALSELAVATYLNENSFPVIHIGAWGNCSADVVCKIQDSNVFVEVKYFSDNPELYCQRIAAVKSNVCAVGYVSNRPTRLNYLYYRIAEAVLQLETKNVRPAHRMVFLVFSELAINVRCELENSFGSRSSWYRDHNGCCPGVLDRHKEKILQKTPQQWLTDSNRVFVGTIKKWQLENITRSFSRQPGPWDWGIDILIDMDFLVGYLIWYATERKNRRRRRTAPYHCAGN